MTTDHHTWAPTMPNRTEHFWDQVGTTLHRTGEVTDDKEAVRAQRVKAIAAMIAMGQLDWDMLQMLLPTQGRTDVPHPIFDSVVGGQG